MDGTKSRWLESLRTVFGADPRSLAIFRIVLGLMILADIILRWPTLEAFTTDRGVVDRETAIEMLRLDYNNEATIAWSLNFLSGELWFQQLLLGVLAVAAASLAIGFMTRIATIACWILVVSLHMRCSVILSSGDTLLRCLLFWSIFTPLGFCWSLDARFAKRVLPDSPSPILTGGTAGLISQMIIMYFFAGIAKWNDYWWQGDAMDYVLRLDIYARPWASSLLEFPLMLKFVSWSTLFAEVFLILLMLLPWRNTWWRSVNMVIYLALHASIASTMSIGLFSYISMMGWLPLLPAAFWNLRLWNRWSWDFGYKSDEFEDPAPEILITPLNNRDWTGGLRLAGNVVSSVMIVYVLLWNIANLATAYDGDLVERKKMSAAEYQGLVHSRRLFALAMPSNLRWIGLITGTAQHFQMFGVPPLTNPWFVYDATLEDGTNIDILRQELVTYDRPESILYSILGHHWRKLHRNCLTAALVPLRSEIAEYLIRKWNREHREGKGVKSLRVTCFEEKTGPQYQNQSPGQVIWFDTTTRKVESLDELEKLLNDNPNMLPGF